MNLVVKDALRQIIGRIASALGGFIVIKLITPYLGPLRFGDYSTILKYFAIRSAFADFGLYVVALKQLGTVKNHLIDRSVEQKKQLTELYGKFVSTRAVMIGAVYTTALVLAYLIPAYTSNPYLIRGLPVGMVFSASFMSAGILQIPLQLYRKMEQLSIGLVLARIAQIVLIVLTIYVRFADVNFTTSTYHISPFLLILASVALSGIVQGCYVYWTGKTLLPLRRERDRSFTKKILKDNWQYGLAYYMSSFHTLVVLILLSIFYPTIEGYTYAGTWALALSLIEILLIVPSALGNSLIHKVAHESTTQKQQRFGHLLMLVVRIGALIIIEFTLFAPHIIEFIGGSEFLSDGHWGSDRILPYLALVLSLSFIKQVFNYLFVSTDLQNKLLQINFIGVVIGTAIGVPLILHGQILGGIITQLFLEILFVGGALIIAHRHRVLPVISKKFFLAILLICSLTTIIGQQYISGLDLALWQRIGGGTLIALVYTGISYRAIKTLVRGL